MAEQLPTSADVAARLRRYRKARNMSAQAFAEALTAKGFTVQRSTIAHHENGSHQTIPVDLVTAAARVFAVPVAALFADAACSLCGDSPPSGMACNACGAGAPRPQA